MEAVVDALILSVDEFRNALSEDGGIVDVVEVLTETKFGNPGLTEIHEYPYFYVEPLRNAPEMETIGHSGVDVRTLSIQIGFVVDAADYFEESVNEVAATRQIVQVGEALWKWLRRFSKMKLGDPSNVRRVIVSAIDYIPQDREGVFTRLASITLAVDKSYQHKD